MPRTSAVSEPDICGPTAPYRRIWRKLVEIFPLRGSCSAQGLAEEVTEALFQLCWAKATLRLKVPNSGSAVPPEGCLSSSPAQLWGCRGWRPALRSWGVSPLAKPPSAPPRCPARAGALETPRSSRCSTWSRALRPGMSQESPRAACRACVTTQLMQPPGLRDTRAASVSVTRALQMASGSSSGSAKMKILGGSRGGERGDADSHHRPQGWQEQLTFHFSHCCC